jgi:hypothetical protein
MAWLPGYRPMRQSRFISHAAAGVRLTRSRYPHFSGSCGRMFATFSAISDAEQSPAPTGRLVHAVRSPADRGKEGAECQINQSP